MGRQHALLHMHMQSKQTPLSRRQVAVARANYMLCKRRQTRPQAAACCSPSPHRACCIKFLPSQEQLRDAQLEPFSGYR